MPRVSTRIDMSGQRIGQWTVLSFDTTRNGMAYWLCQCSCGAERVVRGKRIRDGLRGLRSLDCKVCKACSPPRKRHVSLCSFSDAGKTKLTPTYRSWSAMKRRCLNPRNKAFPNYGGRGITICVRWLTFANFFADMGERPAGMTLDRRDNDGHYEPGNCRWATISDQNRNRRKKAKKK